MRSRISDSQKNIGGNDLQLRIIRGRSEGREERQDLIFRLESSGVRTERFQLIQCALFGCQIRFNIDMRRFDAFMLGCIRECQHHSFLS